MRLHFPTLSPDSRISARLRVFFFALLLYFLGLCSADEDQSQSHRHGQAPPNTSVEVKQPTRAPPVKYTDTAPIRWPESNAEGCIMIISDDEDDSDNDNE